MSYQAKHKVIITKGCVCLDDKEIFAAEENLPFGEFIRQVYRLLGLTYPKFFKMDDLSKLAFIAGEILMREVHTEYAPEQKAILLCNSSSSLDTDIQHQKSIQDPGNFFPSPAVFVYTLPNIAIGELCIRHKVMGENYFFVSEKFSEDRMKQELASILDQGHTRLCLAGWTELLGQEFKAEMRLYEL